MGSKKNILTKASHTIIISVIFHLDLTLLYLLEIEARDKITMFGLNCLLNLGQDNAHCCAQSNVASVFETSLWDD